MIVNNDTKEYQLISMNGFMFKLQLLKKLKQLSFHHHKINNVEHFVIATGDNIQDWQNIFVINNYILSEIVKINKVDHLIKGHMKRKNVLIDTAESNNLISFCSYLEKIIMENK